MVRRGEGYLLTTASVVGLLMAPGVVPYTVSKHAAVALAESLQVLYRGTGVRFSCLCPSLVETPLLTQFEDHPVGRVVRASGEALLPSAAADIVVEGLREEKFPILTHPEAQQVAILRATDPATYLDAVHGMWAAAGGTGH